MTDEAAGEGDHAARHAAVGQKVTGQNEERNRHDLEVLDPGEQLERHGLDRHIGHGEQEGEHRQPEGDGNGHAREHQGEQQGENDQRAHFAPPICGTG